MLKRLKLSAEAKAYQSKWEASAVFTFRDWALLRAPSTSPKRFNSASSSGVRGRFRPAPRISPIRFWISSMVLGTVGLGGTLFPLSGVGVLGSSGSVGFSGSTGGSPGPPGVFGAGKDGLLVFLLRLPDSLDCIGYQKESQIPLHHPYKSYESLPSPLYFQQADLP